MRLSLVIILLLLFAGCARKEVVEVNKKALVIVAPENFRDEEAFHTIEELRNAGIGVVVASTRKGLCRGVLGGEIEAEMSLSEVNVSDFDAVVFIGGPGVPTVRADPEALRIAREAAEKGKIIGAICWAPTILAKAGVLEGKKATVWLGFDPEYGKNTDKVLESYGAEFLNQAVVVDGKTVTANGPRAAREFGRQLAKLILSS